MPDDAVTPQAPQADETPAPETPAPETHAPETHAPEMITGVPGTFTDPDARTQSGTDIPGPGRRGADLRRRASASVHRAAAPFRRAGIGARDASARAGRSAARATRAATAAVHSRIPGTRKGRVLLAGGAAAVVAAVVAGGVAVDAALDRQNLAAAPGGVLALDGELQESWSVAVDGALEIRLVRMPGGVVAAVGRDAVLGLDAASGETLWTVERASAECGPLPVARAERAEEAERLVCVAPAATEDGPLTVTVIGQDGVEATREVEAAAVVRPAADGGLFVVHRTGTPPDPVQPTPEPETDAEGNVVALRGTVEDGWDLSVRMEDAASGEVRWERSLPFEPADLAAGGSCIEYDGATGGPTLALDGALTAFSSPTVVAVAGCGAAGIFTPEGEPIEESPPEAFVLAGGSYYSEGGLSYTSFAGASLPGSRIPLVDGGYVRIDGTIVDEDGTASTPGGVVLDPLTTDGSAPRFMLLNQPSRLVAVDDDGDGRWSSELPTNHLVARTANLAVLLDLRGRLVGVDLRSGEELWATEPELLAVGGWTAVEQVVTEAFTDGSTVLLATPPRPGEPGLRLLAVDLDSGDVTWELKQETPYTQLLAVDGNLVQVTQQGVVGLAPPAR
ncbi:PQQ-binding-like beta-propeller repeat protein [Antribacter gilvus]|uniref:outer membrane protein assembly factor BamB family protein n=1 Tax=Antribacter gilvus TaxID=2304675 RepID=UPI000F79D181|nr:PQQ-binding-like beta-propeller repeat protein [Antribacter gilvus]